MTSLSLKCVQGTKVVAWGMYDITTAIWHYSIFIKSTKKKEEWVRNHHISRYNLAVKANMVDSMEGKAHGQMPIWKLLC